MPIKIGDQTFQHFAQAVAYIVRTKRFSKKRAGAYVYGIEHPEKKNRRARWRGK